MYVFTHTSATKTHDFIRQTLDTTNDPALKNALTECENACRVITESFTYAAVSFFQNDYESVQEDENATPRAEASCEETLHASPNNLNLLDNRNRQIDDDSSLLPWL